MREEGGFLRRRGRERCGICVKQENLLRFLFFIFYFILFYFILFFFPFSFFLFSPSPLPTIHTKKKIKHKSTHLLILNLSWIPSLISSIFSLKRSIIRNGISKVPHLIRFLSESSSPLLPGHLKTLSIPLLELFDVVLLLPFPPPSCILKRYSEVGWKEGGGREEKEEKMVLFPSLLEKGEEGEEWGYPENDGKGIFVRVFVFPCAQVFFLILFCALLLFSDYYFQFLSFFTFKISISISFVLFPFRNRLVFSTNSFPVSSSLLSSLSILSPSTLLFSPPPPFNL